MLFLRRHIALRFAWLMMALHIFNLSVDAPDAHSDKIPEDLSFNDMESVAEIILEKILSIDGALAEHDEDDPDEEGGGIDFKKELFLGIGFDYLHPIRAISFLSPATPRIVLSYLPICGSILHPPPRVAVCV